MLESNPLGKFPVASGLMFGLGLGGFFDGIVFHQLLQWHHMVSSWYPPTSLENLRLNTLWDGIFHSSTYVLVVLALYVSQRLAWDIGFLVGRGDGRRRRVDAARRQGRSSRAGSANRPAQWNFAVKRQPLRLSDWLPRIVLAAALVLATWPAWRVLTLGERPTLEELMQWVCSSRE